MNRLHSLPLLVCLVIGTNAATACAESKSGAVKFTGVGNEAVRVAMGNKLKLDVAFKQIRVGDLSAVSVSGQVKNTANEKLHYAYFVSFLDQDKNLIGCQHFILFVDGGKQGSAGTFIQLPPDQIARIASYSIAFYESNQAIGK